MTENSMEAVGEWHRIQATSGQLIPPARSHAASCIVGDELYVFGGFAGQGAVNMFLGDLWKYSFEYDAWEEVQVLSDIMPVARSRAGFAVCPSSLTIYMFGGWIGGSRFNDFWKFDIRSQRWNCIHEGTSDNSAAAQGVNGRIPPKRYGHVSAIHNGKFILFGGQSGSATQNDLHVFDLATETWTEIKPQHGDVWPTTRSHAAAMKDLKHLYIHGGYSRTDKRLKSDFFALELETYKWKEMSLQGSAPSPRDSHHICLQGNRLYLYGGCLEAGPPFNRSIEMYVYNTESGQWKQEKYKNESGPSARGGAAVHIHDNLMYLFGGGVDPNAVLNDFYRFGLDPIVSLPTATIGSDIQRLVNNPKFADVHFIVEGKEVNAHKNILAMRSEYFDTMLSGGMREGTSEKPIEISEVSHATFVNVLEFLYSDQVKWGSFEEAKQLLIASDMFQLERLKALCENWISQKLSNVTVISILLLSHRHQAIGLKECAMDYLMRNWSDPIVKQHRNELHNDSDLMLEIIQHKDLSSKKERS